MRLLVIHRDVRSRCTTKEDDDDDDDIKKGGSVAFDFIMIVGKGWRIQ